MSRTPRVPTAVSSPGRAAILLLALALALTGGMVLAAGPIAAQTVREADWYTVEVPVRSQEARERDAALGRALAQVLVRVTGRADAPADPVLQRALRVADTMLVDTEYRQVEVLAGGVPVAREVLAASFDPDAVDALVMAAGLPLWSGERPRPLLWLVIDDGGGGGPRLVSAPQINVVKPLADRGLERGLRFLLPAGSPVEQAAAARIWALDAPALGLLSARYGARVQLLGKLSRAAGGWQAEWLLADGGAEIKRWSRVDPSPQLAIASGADRSADALAARQARAVPTGTPETLLAEIVGIDGPGRWPALAAYLQSLPVLRSVDVLEAHPDRVRVRLDLAVDRARFEAMLAGGRHLAVEPALHAPGAAEATDAPAAPEATDAPLLRYRLRP